jgi:ATP-dependent DNA helicase RecQ
LGFSKSNEFIASFNRENLFLEVIPKRDPAQQAVRFLGRFPDQSGIIYCFSRKQVDELSAYLAQKGFSARPYHAGLDDSERKANQEAFIRDDIQIIVATIAFGMGINKPNVRFVLHYDLPKSIESYYQEIGRAGRDGLPAHCLLLYSYSDVAKLRYFVDQKEGLERRVAMEHLDAMVRYAEDDTTCRRKPILTYFGEPFTASNCGNCDNCSAAPPALSDITLPAQKFLSCVRRTGERFGAAHVIAVLRGSKDEKVLRYKHEQLSTYGIGADWPEKQWMQLARQLVRMGYLNQDSEYRTLSLTDKAVDALRDRTPIKGHLQIVEERPRAVKAAADGLAYNHALFALLRQKRKDLADQAGVPPYVIFSDKTLVEMATYYPQSMRSLLNISGVGQVKQRQYGEAFLEVLRSFCKKHAIEETDKKGGSKQGKNEAGQRYVMVGTAYNAGETVEGLAERYQVTVTTILNHLEHFATAGYRLRAGDDLLALANAAPEQQKAALAAFTELGAEYLKPVFERLGGSLDYNALRILRLAYLASGQ